MLNEKINSDEKGNWTCICGNHANSDGFYICDEKGKEVEPTPEAWDGLRYCCDSCGRIISDWTLDVIGKREEVKQ